MEKTITRFEDLFCWQAARVLNKSIFICCRQGELSKDWDFKSQIRRASLSIMNNIAEGFGRFSDKDSSRFLDIAKASAYEVNSMLYVLSDVEYLDEPTIQSLHQQVDKALQLTLGFIRYQSKKLTK